MHRPTLAIVILLALTAAGCGGRTGLVEEPGRSGALAAGRQDGTWTYRDAAGRPTAAGRFVGDLQDGPWTWWHPDGSVRIQGAYVRGMRTGLWKHLHPGGAVAATGTYQSDRQEGDWSYQDAAGRPQAVGRFRAGVRDGRWRWYWPGGQLRQAGWYHAGLRVGTWMRWQADGRDAGREDLGAPAGVARDPAWDADAETAPALAVVAVAVAEPPTASSMVIRDAPVTNAAAPTSDRQIADADPADAPLDASPSPLLPQWFTVAQMASAAQWLSRYANGAPAPAGYGETTAAASRPVSPLLGKPLPQTRFLGPDGGILDIDAFRQRGPVVVVVMRGFAGQVCLYCATQTAALSDAIGDFRDAGAEVVVVYPGPVSSVPAFVAAVQSLRADPPPMPLALDASLLLVRALGIEANLARPTSLVIDRAGLVRYAYVGETIADRPSVPDLLDAVRRAR
jgi:peroxiredoxin